MKTTRFQTHAVSKDEQNLTLFTKQIDGLIRSTVDRHDIMTEAFIYDSASKAVA